MQFLCECMKTDVKLTMMQGGTKLLRTGTAGGVHKGQKSNPLGKSNKGLTVGRTTLFYSTVML